MLAAVRGKRFCSRGSAGPRLPGARASPRGPGHRPEGSGFLRAAVAGPCRRQYWFVLLAGGRAGKLADRRGKESLSRCAFLSGAR